MWRSQPKKIKEQEELKAWQPVTSDGYVARPKCYTEVRSNRFEIVNHEFVVHDETLLKCRNCGLFMGKELWKYNNAPTPVDIKRNILKW